MTPDGRCAHLGCERKIRKDRFACDQHWSQLPEGIKYQAWGAYESWAALPGSQVARAKVNHVQAQAILWWRREKVA